QFSPIPVAPAAIHYPLSSSQRRLWVLSEFEEGNIAYNIPGINEFEGDLDTAGMEYAFASLIGRHEILRTFFEDDAQGEVWQVVLPAAACGFGIRYHDLRTSGGLEEMLAAEFSQPFDLRTGPLLRVSLYR